MQTRFSVRVGRAVRASFVVSLASLASLVLCSGCHVDANVKASSNVNEPIVDRSDTESSKTAPEPSAAPETAPAQAPIITAPPADACPLVCHEARGSERANLTAEEIAQLRTALEPVLGRMRTCTSPEGWRRHGSPVVNLRIAPDGTLGDLGVDPHHGRDSACFDDAGRSADAVSLSLPGRRVVRCAERCGRGTSGPGERGTPRSRRRGRGR